MRWKESFLIVVFISVVQVSKGYTPPVMGWSSWNTYGINISDSLIRMQADALKVTGLYRVGFDHVNIDDGYFGGRDENGKLLTNPHRFPDGFDNLVTYLHNGGFKAGIYSDAGDNSCASGYSKDPLAFGIGLYQHDSIDVDRFFNDWNFDFIKVDYCGGSHLKLNERIRYTQIAEALKKYTDKEVEFNVCRWAFPGTWVCPIAGSWRTTGDINTSWNSLKSIIAKNLYLSAYASDGHYNDMDMLEIGRGLSKEEENTHFGLWCMMSSPLLIGCDVTKIPKHSLQLLLNKDLIALDQDSLALQAHVAYCSNDCYVLVKDLKKTHGRKRAVAFYNPNDKVKRCILDLAQLDYEGKTVNMKNLFTGEIFPQQGNRYLTIPAHGTLIYRLRGNRTDFTIRYEAEDAWLKKYQKIWNDVELITPAKKKNASGGMIVKFLGNDPDNYMEWRRIFVPKEGDYKLTMHYYTKETRSFSVAVNGRTVRKVVASSTDNGVGSVSLNIHLEKFSNTLRLFNNSGWAPDLDFIEIRNI